MMDWFRWHHGTVTDPKFALVARKAGASLPDVLAIWAYLLEKASAAADRGSFGEVDAEALDCLFAFPEGRTADVLAALDARRLTAEGRFIAWEVRQPKREREDATTAERQRASRQRKAAVTPSNAKSRQVTPRGEESREEAIELPSHPEIPSSSEHLDSVGGFEGHTPEQIAAASERGRFLVTCATTLRQAGVTDASASNPHLLAALADGITVEELRDAAGLYRGKPMKYLVTAIRTQRSEAAASRGALPARPGPVFNPEGTSPRRQSETPQESEEAYAKQQHHLGALSPEDLAIELARIRAKYTAKAAGE